MASSGKKKTTMAKLTRESKLRERRLDKQARKDARKHASNHPDPLSETLDAPGNESSAPAGEQALTDVRQPALEAVGPGLADA